MGPCPEGGLQREAEETEHRPKPDGVDQQGEHPGVVSPPGVGEDLVPYDGRLLRRHSHPGQGPLEAPPLGFAGVALVGHPQSLGIPLGPAGPPAVGEDEEGNPCRRQGLLPRSDLVIWLCHPVGGQGIVQVGQQEFHPPGPEAGEVDGGDAREVVIWNQGKFHSVTF